jgi:hypothetical protein
MGKKEKIAYDTYELAFAEIERQLSSQHKPWLKSRKVCCRVYFEDGKWYLTSKPSITIY